MRARALETWQDVAEDNSALAKMDNGAAATAYAHLGSGCSRVLTSLARRTQDFEISKYCTLAARRTSGERYSAADTFSHYFAQMYARDLYPTGQLRDKFRQVVVAECSKVDVDVMACGVGSNAWCWSFRPPIRRRLWHLSSIKGAVTASQYRYGVPRYRPLIRRARGQAEGGCLLSDPGPEPLLDFQDAQFRGRSPLSEGGQSGRRRA